jgi:hypothetical protein
MLSFRQALPLLLWVLVALVRRQVEMGQTGAPPGLVIFMVLAVAMLSITAPLWADLVGPVGAQARQPRTKQAQ